MGLLLPLFRLVRPYVHAPAAAAGAGQPAHRTGTEWSPHLIGWQNERVESRCPIGRRNGHGCEARLLIGCWNAPRSEFRPLVGQEWSWGGGRGSERVWPSLPCKADCPVGVAASAPPTLKQNLNQEKKIMIVLRQRVELDRMFIQQLSALDWPQYNWMISPSPHNSPIFLPHRW